MSGDCAIALQLGQQEQNSLSEKKKKTTHFLRYILIAFQMPEFLVMPQLKHEEKVHCFSPGLLALMIQIY